MDSCDGDPVGFVRDNLASVATAKALAYAKLVSYERTSKAKGFILSRNVPYLRVLDKCIEYEDEYLRMFNSCVWLWLSNADIGALSDVVSSMSRRDFEVHYCMKYDDKLRLSTEALRRLREWRSELRSR